MNDKEKVVERLTGTKTIDLLCRLHDKFIEAIKSRNEEGKCCLTIDESKLLDEVESHIKSLR